MGRQLFVVLRLIVAKDLCTIRNRSQASKVKDVGLTADLYYYDQGRCGVVVTAHANLRVATKAADQASIQRKTREKVRASEVSSGDRLTAAWPCATDGCRESTGRLPTTRIPHS